MKISFYLSDDINIMLKPYFWRENAKILTYLHNVVMGLVTQYKICDPPVVYWF